MVTSVIDMACSSGTPPLLSLTCILLADMADPPRRDSAPAFVMQSVQRRRTVRRTKTSGQTGPHGEGKASMVPRFPTCPDFVMKEEQVFTVTDVKITEMTVDRHCE